jgi:chemotaxis protein MotA
MGPAAAKQAVMQQAAPEPGLARHGMKNSSAHGNFRFRSIDRWMLAGIAIALGATLIGIGFTSVKISYFLQPSALFIVVGGTLGVTLITTPRLAFLHAARTVLQLLERPPAVAREKVLEELLACAKVRRKDGLLAIKPVRNSAGGRFLDEVLSMTVDLPSRSDFQLTLENKIRLRERQAEADAKALEVAGSFAPTVGVLGTVVGLIDVLHQFSNLSGAAFGIGTAFVSTIYGLSLANLILLPAAFRIRANAAERFAVEEMILEGGLGLIDGTHPSLLRERLSGYLRTSELAP